MRIVRGLDQLQPGSWREPVCTVGVFDGVHRGHRQLLYELTTWAREAGGEPVVLTFPRPPVEVLRGIEVPALLSLDHRLLMLERHGVAGAVVLDFEEVRELEAEAFLGSVVRDRLGCMRFLLGYDSRVGRGGTADAKSLPGIGLRLGIEVRVASRVLDRDGVKIGSSAIREAILRGDLERAANLLGHPVGLRGRVVRGAGRGRGLGTATANLELDRRALPPDGVYLVRVFRGADSAPGLANLGVRPTFDPSGPRTVEVHVPGWTGEIYGDYLEIQFVRKLRDEVRFETAEALQGQIARDLEALAQAVAGGGV